MLSLDNTYDEEEFFEFDQRLRRIFETEKLSYVVEPKIDGVAISLTYKNGNWRPPLPVEMVWREISLPKTSNTLNIYPIN
jgi:hypothetical protein